MNDSIQSDNYLSKEQISSFIKTKLKNMDLAGQRVLILMPDTTRTMPTQQVFEVIRTSLEPVVSQVDFMVALGTHPALSPAELSGLFGQEVVDGRIGSIRIFNHSWDDPASLATIGLITEEEITKLSRGKLHQDLIVRINRRIFDYDHLIIFGPVFPHEVVGFSGGNKYFFPGISGPEVINLTHWLGALLTSYTLIGSGYTPVRAMIDRAAEMIEKPRTCFAFVLDGGGTYGIFAGSPETAWEDASALSAEKHIIRTGRTYQRVLSVMPPMYTDLWVGAKGMYKVEPVVADGGEVIIYAPQIHEISPTHGAILEEIGYHVIDYFTSQWDQFKDYPLGVLAHATHVKGRGWFDVRTGNETARIKVTLATGIPESVCRAINLGYRDPKSILIDDWAGCEDEGILLVRNAGEHLYRVQ